MDSPGRVEWSRFTPVESAPNSNGVASKSSGVRLEGPLDLGRTPLDLAGTPVDLRSTPVDLGPAPLECSSGALYSSPRLIGTDPPATPAARRDRRCPRPAPAARLRRPHCPCACPPPPHSPRASPCRACRPRSSRPTFSLSRAELITHRPRLPRRFRMKGQADPPTNLCASSWRRRPRPSRDAQVRAAPRAVPTFLRVSFIALAPSCDV